MYLRELGFSFLRELFLAPKLHWKAALFLLGALIVSPTVQIPWLEGIMSLFGLGTFPTWVYWAALTATIGMAFALRAAYLVTPRVIATGKELFPSDGDTLARVVVKNFSTREISGIVCKLTRVTGSANKNLDLPILIPTQRQLSDAIKDDEWPRSGFNLRGGEPKKLELFRFKKSSPEIEIIHERGRTALLILEMKLEYEIFDGQSVSRFAVHVVDCVLRKPCIFLVRDEMDDCVFHSLPRKEWLDEEAKEILEKSTPAATVGAANATAV